MLASYSSRIYTALSLFVWYVTPSAQLAHELFSSKMHFCFLVIDCVKFGSNLVLLLFFSLLINSHPLIFSAKLTLHYCGESKFNRVSDQATIKRQRERDR